MQVYSNGTEDIVDRDHSHIAVDYQGKDKSAPSIVPAEPCNTLLRSRRPQSAPEDSTFTGAKQIATSCGGFFYLQFTRWMCFNACTIHVSLEVTCQEMRTALYIPPILY